MSKNKSEIKKDGGIISIKQARAEAQKWRDSVAPGGNFTESFFIPMYDMNQLVEKYKQYGPTGVRAYVGIRETDDPESSDLCLLLVPATENEDFYDKGPGTTDDDDNSSVFDFTRPCPDLCATVHGLLQG